VSARSGGQGSDEHRDVGPRRHHRVDTLPLADLKELGQPTGVRVDRSCRPTQIGPYSQSLGRTLMPTQNRPLLLRNHRRNNNDARRNTVTAPSGLSTLRVIPRNY